MAIVTTAPVPIPPFFLIYLVCSHCMEVRFMPACGQKNVLVGAFCWFSLRYYLFIYKMSQESLSCFAVVNGFAGVTLKNRPWMINQLIAAMSHCNTYSLFFWLSDLLVQYIYLHEIISAYLPFYGHLCHFPSTSPLPLNFDIGNCCTFLK